MGVQKEESCLGAISSVVMNISLLRNIYFFSCITEHVCVCLFYPCAHLTVRHIGGTQGHDPPREKDSHHHLPNLAT